VKDPFILKYHKLCTLLGAMPYSREKKEN